MNKIKTILKSNILYLIGALLGGLTGYAYWAFIGCLSGTCPITSSPFMSTLWGATTGALLLGLFKQEKKKA